jgi:flagellin-like hook-associated protein FlgL
MSADPVGEPVRRTDDDVLGTLASIDHRLHQISTQLATMGKLLSQLDELGANLESLIRPLRSAGRS